jgi:hypothetical protein
LQLDQLLFVERPTLELTQSIMLFLGPGFLVALCVLCPVMHAGAHWWAAL